MSRFERIRFFRWNLIPKCSCLKRRPAHDAEQARIRRCVGGLRRARRDPGHRAAAHLSLVSEDVGCAAGDILSRDRIFPGDFSVDVLLGDELLLSNRAWLAPVLVQQLCSWSGERARRARPVHCLYRSPSLATFCQTALTRDAKKEAV